MGHNPPKRLVDKLAGMQIPKSGLRIFGPTSNNRAHSIPSSNAQLVSVLNTVETFRQWERISKAAEPT